jgi:hypothetical protein
MDIIGNSNYLIYEDGRVQNKKTKRYLKYNPRGNGYKSVSVYNGDGKRGRKTYFIHRLLALHFIPNPHNYPIVDHIDRNPNNNSLSNLRWATQSMNMRNRGIPSNNTSGHKNIYYDKCHNNWRFMINKNARTFKTKTDALCYKYIYLLKMKVNKNIT